MRKLYIKKINPFKLTENKQKTLAKELWKIHKKIFNNSTLTEEIFNAVILGKDTERTRINVFKNENGTIVGYCAYHIHQKIIQGKKKPIFKAEAGIMKAYRGSSSTLLTGVWEALRYKLLHPLTDFNCFEMLINPSSFHLFSKYTATIYPNPQQHMKNEKLPKDIDTLMKNLITSSQLPLADSNNPYIVNFGLNTIETDEDKKYWESCSHPDIQLFLKLNPEYNKGYGLATLVPITFKNLFYALGVYSWMKIKNYKTSNAVKITENQEATSLSIIRKYHVEDKDAMEMEVLVPAISNANKALPKRRSNNSLKGDHHPYKLKNH